jgi:flagellar protein FlaJ
MPYTRKKIVIPMNPLPLPLLQHLAEKLLPAGASLARSLPYLKLELEQADSGLEVEEYISMGLVVGITHFILWSFMLSLLMIIAVQQGAVQAELPFAIMVGIGLGFVLGALVLFQVSQYPKIQIKKKIRDLEQNLIFGLRTITIQIRSGVSLFNALSLVADGKYGALSSEFRKTIDEINTGMPEEDALQRSAMRNPSLFYRRAVWQIVNGMKAGADITKVLSELVHSMTKEQVLQIKKYGAALRLLSLIYMMLGVIIPALGLTFMIILSTFPQIPVTPELLWGFLGFLIIAQVMFVGFVKSKRPSLMTSD